MNFLSTPLDHSLKLVGVGYLGLSVSWIRQFVQVYLLCDQELVIDNALSSIFSCELQWPFLLVSLLIGTSLAIYLPLVLICCKLRIHVSLRMLAGFGRHFCSYLFLSLLFVQELTQLYKMLILQVVFVQLALYKDKLLGNRHFI